MRVQDDDGLSGELPRSVALQDPESPSGRLRIPWLMPGLTSCTGTPAPWKSWMKSTTKSTRPCMKYVARKMLAWYIKYPESTQERRGRRGCRGQRSYLRAPPTAPPRQQKRVMALSDDEGQADK
jgi:hypothetical protein